MVWQARLLAIIGVSSVTPRMSKHAGGNCYKKFDQFRRNNTDFYREPTDSFVVKTTVETMMFHRLFGQEDRQEEPSLKSFEEYEKES